MPAATSQPLRQNRVGLARAITIVFKEAGLAAAAILCAVLLRLALEPVLGDLQPFATLYGAIAVTIFYARWPVAVAAAIAGYLSAHYLFISAGVGRTVPNLASGVVMLEYAFSTSLIILMGEMLRRARDAASRNATLLQEKQRQLEHFIAVLSHELRNPISAVTNALSVIKDDSSEIWKAQALDIAKRQMNHVARLVADLLEVERITNNKLILVKERAELLPILQQAIETATPLLRKGNHALSIDAPDTPVILDCDAARICQIFSNLIGNAAKFSPAGTPIEVRVKRHDSYVSIAVRDEGIGIAPERLKKRLGDLASSGRQDGHRNDGLGLGLGIVQRLTEMHGGTVEVHSAGLDQGSEFTVTLPCAEAVNVEPSEATSDVERRVLR